MIIWYKLLSSILIILYILCFWKIKNRGYIFSPIFSFVMGIVYFVLFPFVLLVFAEKFSLNPLSGATGYWSTVDLNKKEYIYPFFVIWTSLLLCSLSILIFPMKESRTDSIYFHMDQKLFRKLKFVLIFSMVVLIVDWGDRIIQLGGISQYLQYNWYLRNELLFNKYGRLYVYFTKISHANIIIFTATSILYTLVFFAKKIKGVQASRRLFISVILFHLLIIFLSGNRIFFAIYLILTFFGFAAYGYKKQITLSVIILPVVLFIFSAWSYTRSSLSNFSEAFGNYLESLRSLDNGLVSMLFDISEGANILTLFHIINDYGRIYEFLNGATYFRLLGPILPIKVETFTVIIGGNYMPGTNVSLNSTILGELFANFGLWIIVFLPILSLLFILVGKKLNVTSTPIVSLLCCVLICWCVRSIFADNFILLIISLLLLGFQLFVYKIFVKISSSSNNI
ncbi:O-antigen polymerase [Priestia megaterium]|uniref:O-antigen polymerase n=1 Tax=Priestia megaterium TaxID=1404 RepID=UPI001E3781FA|nr:O-antigen polymerase [Priestia megaterium]MCE4089465.1 oligosaccharide repeat unit polymerase [Priestia megaterium]